MKRLNEIKRIKYKKSIIDTSPVEDQIADWIMTRNTDWACMNFEGCSPTLTSYNGKKIILFRFQTFGILPEYLEGLHSDNFESWAEKLAYGFGSNGTIVFEQWIKISKKQYDQLLYTYRHSDDHNKLYAEEDLPLRIANSMNKTNLTDYT